MHTLFQDLRYGLRMLARNPGFTAVAVLTLALGIGANTAIFSIVNAWLLRPLAYEDPGRLVQIWEFFRRSGHSNEVAAANYFDWREQGRVFEQMAAYHHRTFTLVPSSGQPGEPERVTGGGVSAGFFRLLGARVVRGRDFAPEDEHPDSPRVAILTHEYWQSRFGGDPALLGASIQLNGVATTVVGVLAPNFHLPHLRRANIFFSIAMRPETRRNRTSHWLYVLGRLRPGVSLRQAQAEMDAVAGRLEAAYPENNTGEGIRLVPLRDQIVEADQSRLLLLSGTVILVLLIACANIVNLLLARASDRVREMAVRQALGAGRWRLVRQFLTETVVLFLAGGALAILLAHWSLGMIVAGIPADVRESMRDLGKIEIDGTVLGFSLGISLLAGLLCGLAPALLGTQLDVQHALKEGGGRVSGGLHRTRLRSGLVVGQVALAITLLVGAGLLVRSLVRLLRVDPGFQPEQVVATQVLRLGVPEDQALVAFQRAVLANVESLPGVVKAGWISHVPFSGANETNSFRIEGRPEPRVGQVPMAQTRFASEGYFTAAGIAPRQGRLITDQDNELSRPVVLINETMAKSHWSGADPVGQRIRIGPRSTTWREIVGVVRDVKHFALNDPPENQMYLPFAQAPNIGMNLVLRTTADHGHLAGAIRQAVREVDRNQPISPLRPITELVARQHFRQRLSSHVVGLFAALALFLAAIGIYGVLAYSVTQRTHEIGVRVALGARRADVLAMILWHGMKLSLLGVVIGLAGAAALARSLSRLLFGVSPADPLTFAGIVLLFTLVALFACYVPARRAMRVEPMVALRYE